MTNDAKMGLLLGFLLIIAIVFAVNGLPKFIKASDAPEISQNIISHRPAEDLMVIARKTAQQFEIKPEIEPAKLEPLPEATAQSVKKKHFFKEYYADASQTVNQNAENTYTVQANDTLADIAKKFYGPEEGNRLVNIEKIAKFNGLKTANFICQGQKLKIPVLNEAVKQNFVTVNSFAPTKPQKPINNIRNVIELPLVSATHRSGSGVYVVKQGDTLWSIAAKMMGSGERCRDILRANKSLKNSDEIYVGMKLIIPVKR